MKDQTNETKPAAVLNHTRVTETAAPMWRWKFSRCENSARVLADGTNTTQRSPTEVLRHYTRHYGSQREPSYLVRGTSSRTPKPKVGCLTRPLSLLSSRALVGGSFPGQLDNFLIYETPVSTVKNPPQTPARIPES